MVYNGNTPGGEWKEYRAVDESFEDMRSDIEALIDDMGLPDGYKMKLILGFEEIMENIISYAYDKTSQACPVWIRLFKSGNNVIMDIMDRGAPFDPLAVKDARPKEVGLRECKLGGYGIHLVKKFFTECLYTYGDYGEHKVNHITLIMDIDGVDA